MRTGVNAVRWLSILVVAMVLAGTAVGGWEEDLRKGKGTGVPEGFLKADRLATVNRPDGKPRPEKEVKELTEAMKGTVKEHLDTREKAVKELGELLRGRTIDCASRWSRVCGDRQRILRAARDKYRKAFSTKEMERVAFEVIGEFLEAEISQWGKVDSTGKAMIVEHDLLLKQLKVLTDEEKQLAMRIDFFHQEAVDFDGLLDEIEDNYMKDWSPESVETADAAEEFLGKVSEDLKRMDDEVKPFRILRANVDKDTEEITEFAKQYDAKKLADEVRSIISREVFSGPSAAFYARFEKDWEADLAKVDREYSDAYDKYLERAEQWDDMIKDEYAVQEDKYDRFREAMVKLVAEVEDRHTELEKAEAEKPGDEGR
jgi:hypothetical protein